MLALLLFVGIFVAAAVVLLLSLLLVAGVFAFVIAVWLLCRCCVLALLVGIFVAPGTSMLACAGCSFEPA